MHKLYKNLLGVLIYEFNQLLWWTWQQYLSLKSIRSYIHVALLIALLTLTPDMAKFIIKILQ